MYIPHQSYSFRSGRVQESRGLGTPQGGVISPLLSNLYLHYCIDRWMQIYYPKVEMVRYADDLIIHCGSIRMRRNFK